MKSVHLKQNLIFLSIVLMIISSCKVSIKLEKSPSVSLAENEKQTSLENTNSNSSSTNSNHKAVVLIGSNGGYFYISTDDGDTFNKVNTLGNFKVQILRRSHISLDQQTIAIGFYPTSASDPSIMISNDKGQNWSYKTLPGNLANEVSAPYVSDDGKYINVSGWGYDGFYRSDDYGASFSQIDTDSRVAHSMSADGKYQIAAEWYGDRKVSSDYGQTWTAYNRSSEQYAANTSFIQMSQSGEYILLGERYQGSSLLTNYGTSENLLINPSTSYTPVAMSLEAELMAVLNDDTRVLSYSNDYGANWQTLTAPGSSSNINATLVMSRSKTFSEMLFYLNTTDLPKNLYLLNKSSNEFDLSYTFANDIATLATSEDKIFVTLTNGDIYRAKLSDLSTFTFLYNIPDADINLLHLDAR